MGIPLLGMVINHRPPVLGMVDLDGGIGGKPHRIIYFWLCSSTSQWMGLRENSQEIRKTVSCEFSLKPIH